MILHNGQGLLFIIPPVRVVQPSAICQILVNGTEPLAGSQISSPAILICQLLFNF